MEVTREIVNDLLPVYMAGEASGDTRRLVEEFLKQDPELARRVRESDRALPMDAVAPPANVEVRALARTRSYLRARGFLMGLAIWFSLMPMSMAFDGSRVRWAMWRDAPGFAALSLAVGLMLWVAYFVWGRRLRATEL